jgi:glycerol-3-phosphate dehydrogenase
MAERLCLENALDAAAHGAVVVNHARARGLLRQDGRVEGLEVEDTLTAKRHRLNARLVINAAGPWADEVRGLAGGEHSPMVRTTRGVHLIADTVCQQGIVLTARSDGRLFFVLPWLGHSLIGTTDTDESHEPGQVRPETEDVAYLLAEAQKAFPSLVRQSVLGAYAGVRALAGTVRGKESDVSRRPRIVDHAGEGLPGLVSVVGGKLTAYRQVSETVTDLACRLLGVREACLTAGRPLPGAPDGDLAALLATAGRAALASGLTATTGEYLARVYGSRHTEVLALAEEDSRGTSPLCSHTPAIVAQVWHAVDREWARTPADFLLRRALLGLTPPCFGLDAVEAVAEEMGRRIGWSAEEVRDWGETYCSGLRDEAWLQVGHPPESPAVDRS